ncbi:MAG: hypothetical protein GY853_14010 [PVC group bacterium]|nr:hypothetical protein [PVC group bacterium]
MENKFELAETPAETQIEAIESNGSPIAVLQMAMSKDIDLGKMEKMLELQAKWDDMQAKKAYTQAMANFKSDPPKIVKDKKVGYNNKDGSATGYTHASLGNVTNTINSALATHGLSAAWQTDQKDGNITVTCTITHSMGYSESTSLSAGADNSGRKNNLQAIGSTNTYLQRYTLLSLTGLATHDQDDDGSSGEMEEYIDDEQKHQILDMIAHTEANVEKFLNCLGVANIESIPKKMHNIAIIALNANETIKKIKKETKKEKTNDNN